MSADTPRYHVLLVGIDAYSVKPLYGCVNDIDAVRDLLVRKAGIPEASITRLAAPHLGRAATAPPESSLPTLVNIRAALRELGTEKVSREDRVLIYYSGHGAHLAVKDSAGSATYYREALVPVNFNATPGSPNLLLDSEINNLLSEITKRTASVCVILDCCHSAGATRDFPAEGKLTRFLSETEMGLAGPLVLPTVRGDYAEERGVGGNVELCQIVTACMNHELAQESVTPDGRRHGLLTYAFLTQLGAIAPNEMKTVAWAHVWQKMRDIVEQANPSQHLWMAGNLARAVLAGPPVDGDAGIAVTRAGDSEYLLDAGTLAGVDTPAQLAVYGVETRVFPPLDSQADFDARIGSLLEVVSATRAGAVARPVGAPFELPQGARARIVAPSAPEKLRCAVVPREGFDVALLASPLIEIVDDAAKANVRLVRRDNGLWALEDDIAGAKREYPPLVTLTDAELDCAREVLEVYYRYSLPLRMAMRCTDLPGQLKVSILACPPDGLPEEDAMGAVLPEQPAHEAFKYKFHFGDTFCIQVRNASVYPLRVTLLNCAASGRVQHVGDQVIEARSYYRFWDPAGIGVPMCVVGTLPYIDRLVAFGTTRVDKSLQFLSNNIRFAEILARSADLSKEVGAQRDISGGSLVERWTATPLTLGVGL